MRKRTLSDVYLEQSSSDMFFNHEGVVKAYELSIPRDTKGKVVYIEPSFKKEKFVLEIQGQLGVNKEDAELIATDFLERL